MAFKLSRDEIKRRDEIAEKLTEAASKLQSEIEDYNAALEQAQAPVQSALEIYNECAATAREFAEDIASQADSDISDKSERWQEGDRGQSAESFKSEWESLSFEEITLDFPEPLEFDDPDHATVLTDAPEQAEG